MVRRLRFNFETSCVVIEENFITITSENYIMSKNKLNTFAAATAQVTETAIAALFNEGPANLQLFLDDIEILPQIRKVFEDEENLMSDLAESIKTIGVFSPVVVRDNGDGKYVLVAGERRCRAARMAGLTKIPVFIQKMTDEQADDIQFFENIKRMNLSMMEEAGKVKAFADKLGKGKGNIEKVCKKFGKSASWVSKRLALTDLPEQANRLITENLSADVEVINMVRVVEKRDKDAARTMVEAVKDGRGEIDARAIAGAFKKAVAKPLTKTALAKSLKQPTPSAPAGIIAAPKDRTQEVPTTGKSFSPAKEEAIKGGDPFGGYDTPALPPTVVAVPASALATPGLFDSLDQAFEGISAGSISPEMAIAAMGLENTGSAHDYLELFFDNGRESARPAKDVMAHLKSGAFATVGYRAFLLAAFLEGSTPNTKFNLPYIFEAVYK